MSIETVPVAAIALLAERALRAHGASRDAAGSVAAAVAAAERDGLPEHGLAHLLTYCEHLDCGKVLGEAVPELVEGANGVVAVDAACGFAHPAIELGISELIPLARRSGIAALAVRNSYDCGVLGYHTESIAELGLVGLGFTNAPAAIAPWGGLKPVLGTNPWSLAVPGTHGVAFVIDQSASVVAQSEVVRRARTGMALEPGWAMDADGQPTTDAQAALGGTMMPSGGAKGVGAALMVEVFAACLAGATPGVEAAPFSGREGGPPRTGQFFIGIHPSAASGGAFSGRLEVVLAAFASEPGAHLPGARRFAARARANRDGVDVDTDLMTRVRALLAR